MDYSRIKHHVCEHQCDRIRYSYYAVSLFIYLFISLFASLEASNRLLDVILWLNVRHFLIIFYCVSITNNARNSIIIYSDWEIVENIKLKNNKHIWNNKTYRWWCLTCKWWRPNQTKSSLVDKTSTLTFWCFLCYPPLSNSVQATHDSRWVLNENVLNVGDNFDTLK